MSTILLLRPSQLHLASVLQASSELRGLPVVADASQPLELQRQVQIAAGSMIVLGTAPGLTLSTWFLMLSGFVGVGLIFAGISDFCGLARLLMKMPWNQSA